MSMENQNIKDILKKESYQSKNCYFYLKKIEFNLDQSQNTTLNQMKHSIMMKENET